MQKHGFAWYAIGVLGALLVLSGAPAEADVMLTAGDILANRGDTADVVDVYLTNTGPSSIDVGGFSFGVTVSGGSGVNFTDVTTATTLFPYIFAGMSLFGPDITDPGQTLPANTITASDLTTDLNGFVTIGPGESVGVGHVFFNVDATAPISMVTINFEPYPTTSLSDQNGGNISYTTAPGTITVVSGVPEPATAELFGLALLCMGIIVRRRRR